MKINYSKILKKNLINVFKDVLYEIDKNGLKDGHHLYITFDVKNNNVKIPNWLKKKFPNEMTIVIQYEYWNFKIKKNSFIISLSFNDIKTNLEISYDSILKFSDPYANFGLNLNNNEKNQQIKKKEVKKKYLDNNIIDFEKFKKN